MNSKTNFKKDEAVESSQSERDALLTSLLAYLNEENDEFEPEKISRRLDRLKTTFLLSKLETQIIAVLWNCAFVPQLSIQLASMLENQTVLSPLLLSSLFTKQPIHRLTIKSGAIYWNLIRQQEFADGNAHLTIDPKVVDWLEGRDYLDEFVLPAIKPLAQTFELKSWNIHDARDEINLSLEQGLACTVILECDDKALAQIYIFEVCKALGVSQKYISIKPQEWNKELYKRVQKFCLLNIEVPAFTYCKELEVAAKNEIDFPIRFIVKSTDDKPDSMYTGAFQNKLISIKLPQLTIYDRKQLIRMAIKSAGSWPVTQLSSISAREDVSFEKIHKASHFNPTSAKHFVEIIDTQENNEVSRLAQKIESDFTWDDLIVADETNNQLEEIVFEAVERQMVWQDPEIARLFPQGRNLVALFAGPPGSGKTMAAQVIAERLGMNLLRVDLSSLVSKWVGETIENIQTLLDSNAAQHSIIFFDEADALFGRRVDEASSANDRYLNMDSGHLMVALESFKGIVLMATNLRGNIDPAFSRRIRHIVDFKKPCVDARNKIWRKYLTAMFGKEVIDLNLISVTRLAGIEATGAQIKNASLSSLLAVKREQVDLTTHLVGKMIGRELAKDGRGMSEKELDCFLQGNLP